MDGDAMFTEQETLQIARASAFAHSCQVYFNMAPGEPVYDHYLFIGEHGWREPFLVCPHDESGRLAILPTRQHMGYPDQDDDPASRN